MSKREASVSRLPAGPGGPISLMADGADRKVKKAAAIHAVCDRLITDGVRPTFAIVRDNRAGFGEATLTRPRYRPIVHAAQKRFDAVAAGVWEEGSVPDEFEQMAAVIAAGEWTIGSDVSQTAAGAAEPVHSVGDPVSEDVARLQRALLAIGAKLARRDEQVRRAVSVARSRGAEIVRQRAKIVELTQEVETLAAVPLPRRAVKVWSD